MQEFTFSTSSVAVYEIATFVKQFALTKELSVKVATFDDSIHVVLLHDKTYKAFSDFILGISTECFERKVSFTVTNVFFYTK